MRKRIRRKRIDWPVQRSFAGEGKTEVSRVCSSRETTQTFTARFRILGRFLSNLVRTVGIPTTLNSQSCCPSSLIPGPPSHPNESGVTVVTAVLDHSFKSINLIDK
eukprot:2505377-Rhodomonas_salina.2